MEQKVALIEGLSFPVTTKVSSDIGSKFERLVFRTQPRSGRNSADFISELAVGGGVGIRIRGRRGWTGKVEQRSHKVTKTEDPQIALVDAELIFSNGNSCAPRKSKSESGDRKPYRCAPLMVAKSSGYGRAATMRWRRGSVVMSYLRTDMDQRT